MRAARRGDKKNTSAKKKKRLQERLQNVEKDVCRMFWPKNGLELAQIMLQNAWKKFTEATPSRKKTLVGF